MGAKAFLGRFEPDLETAIGDAVSTARREDPCAPLTVLVGSNLLGVYLKRKLAEMLGGLFNVGFVTFADMAAIFAGTSSRAAGTLLPSRADRVIIEELVSSGEVPSCFRAAARSRGFARALAATFTDLAEAGCTPEIARSLTAGTVSRGDLSERAKGVLSLYAVFRDAVERLGGDVHSLFREAVSNELPLRSGALVFAYGFYDFNEMQWRLLGRIAAERNLTLFMPWGEREAYHFSVKTRQKLERRGFETVVVPEVHGAAKDSPRPKLLNVPGEEEEVREIARRIIALAREKAVRFGDIAIIVPSMETYGPLLREVLGEARIPYFLGAGSSAEASSSAKGALGLLKLLGAAMERHDLVEFLVSAPLRPAGAGLEKVDHVSRWVRKSAEAGIIGEKGWIDESGALVGKLRSEVEKGAKSEEDLAAALHVDALIRRIAAARDAARKASTWSGCATVLSASVRELLRQSDDTEIVCGAIERLAGLDRIGARTSFETFSRIVESELSGLVFPVGRFGGEGVNILSLGQARGLTFRAVFIPGLAERIFPTVVRQDPLLSDSERRELTTLTSGAVSLSEKYERLSEEALLFEIALQSAQSDIVLSFPRFEEGTGKERIPSSFLRFIEGYSLDGTHGVAFEREWISRGAWAREASVTRRASAADGASAPGGTSEVRGPSPARGAQLLSENELDFAQALGYLSGSGYLPDSTFFSRGARLVKGRWGTRTFTEYDGVFSSKKAVGELRAMLEEHGWRFAPTALEAYASCPFEYFLSRVLKVEVLEEPERIVMLTPLRRGELIHKILARLFGELKDEGLLPVREAPAQRVFEAAERVVARFLEDFPKTEPVGLPVFWEMERRLVKKSVRFLLEEERFEEGGFVPTYFEKSFGGERDHLDVLYECGGRQLHFYGRIDRIDIGRGRVFRVIDYKTGKLSGADQDFAGGTALQLPVYLIAASQILGLTREEGSALYRHVGPGEGKETVVFSGAQWEASEKQFARIVDAIASGIEEGIFFAPADDQECRNCGVRVSCPAGMPRLFALKAAHDERSRAYLEMRGGGEGAQ